MLSKIRPKINPITNIVASKISFIHPNILTFLGILPPMLFLYFLMLGKYGWATAAVIGSLFDMLDGAVARQTKKESAFGGVLDSTLDRVTDGIIITAFGFAELVSWPLVISLLIASYTISYLRSRVELAGNGKFKLDVGIIERPERIILLGAAVLGEYLYTNGFLDYGNSSVAVFWILLILSLITVAQRFVVGYRRLSKLNN